MAAALQPLAQSETKTLFLRRLGLDIENAESRALYQLMKAETLRERDSMHQDRSNLHPHMRDDPAYRSPYSYSWLTETAVHRAISRIFDNASPATKYYYNLGHYTTVVEENWVIRWLLWHVFRYRDARRTRKQGRAGQIQAQHGGEASGAISTSQLQQTVAVEALIGSGHGVTTPPPTQSEGPASFDGGRMSLSHQRSEHEQASAGDYGIGTGSVATTAGSASNTRRVFDPIRDV